MYKLALFVISALCLATHVTAVCPPIPNNQAATINSTDDISKYIDCTSLPGLIIGSGDITGGVTLPNLVTIDFTVQSAQTGFGLTVANSQATFVSLPALTSIKADQLRITNNPNLAVLSLPNVISTQGSSAINTVFANNPLLSNTTLGLTSLNGGGLTIGGKSVVGAALAASGTVNFPNLQSAGALIISYVTNLTTVNLPVLSSLQAFTLQETSLVNFNAPNVITVSSSVISSDVVVQSNPNLVNFTSDFQQATTFTFTGNGATGNPIILNVNKLVSVLAFSVQNNPGLTFLSLASLQYISQSFSVSNNTALQTYYQPLPTYIPSDYQFTYNGATATPVNATLGVQISTGTVFLQNNHFTQAVLNQLGSINAFTVTSNSFTVGFFTQAAYNVTQQFLFTDNTGLQTADFSGLNFVGSLVFQRNTGANSMLFTRLQVVSGSTSNIIGDNSGFTSIVFNSLNSVGSYSGAVQGYYTNNTDTVGDFQIINNNGLTSVVSSGSSRWIATSFQILNNANLNTVSLGGLVQAGVLRLNLAAVTNISLPDLSCVGNLAIPTTANSNVVISVPKLSLFYILGQNAAQSSSACTQNLGTFGSRPCLDFCFTCPNTAQCGSLSSPPTGLSNLCLTPNSTGGATTFPATCTAKSALVNFNSSQATPVPYTSGIYNAPTPVPSTGGTGSAPTVVVTTPTGTIVVTSGATTTTTGNPTSGNGNTVITTPTGTITVNGNPTVSSTTPNGNSSSANIVQISMALVALIGAAML